MAAFRWTKPGGHWELTPTDPARWVYGIGELLAPGPRPPADDGDHWGPWYYRRRTRELVYREGRRERYWVPLDRCATSAQVLDWLAQLSHKAWCGAGDVGFLLKALDDLLDLQATRCGFGVERSAPVPQAACRRRPCRAQRVAS